MKVVLAKKAGFCMGVRRAMEIVLQLAVEEESPIFTYGPLIHNPQVMEILKDKGIGTITSPDEVKEGSIIVIRAHGVPPEIKEEIKKKGGYIVDATCPRVIKVQSIIKRYAKEGYHTVIVGEKEHPEVIGLMGYTEGRGIVIDSESQVDLPPDANILIVAQTTQDEKVFDYIVTELKKRYPQVAIHNTICNATHNRQKEARRLSSRMDAMVVIGGHNSGNTKRLSQICAKSGIEVFQIETEKELDREKLKEFGEVGVTAGASTPNWMIKRVVEEIKSIPGKKENSLYRFIRNFFSLLLKTNIYLAIGAGGLAWSMALVQGFHPSWRDFFLSFFYIQAMTTMNHLIDMRSGEINRPDRANFYKKWRRLITLTGVGSSIISILIALSIGLVPFLLMFAMNILGLVYGLPILPKKLSKFVHISKMRDISGSKTIVVSTGWAVVCAFMPAFSHGFQWSTILGGFIVFLMVFVRETIGDLVDLQGDLIVGRETLAVILGEDRTKKILYWVPLLLSLVLIAGYLFNFFTSMALLFLLSVSYIFFYLMLDQRIWSLGKGFLYEFLVDTTFIIAWFLGILWQTWISK